MSKAQSSQSSNQQNQTNQQSQRHQSHAVNSSAQNRDPVLLATAIINLVNSSGLKIPARAVLNKSGDHSIIQEKFAKKFGFNSSKRSSTDRWGRRNLGSNRNSIFQIGGGSIHHEEYKVGVFSQ